MAQAANRRASACSSRWRALLSFAAPRRRITLRPSPAKLGNPASCWLTPAPQKRMTSPASRATSSSSGMEGPFAVNRMVSRYNVAAMLSQLGRSKHVAFCQTRAFQANRIAGKQTFRMAAKGQQFAFVSHLVTTGLARHWGRAYQEPPFGFPLAVALPPAALLRLGVAGRSPFCRRPARRGARGISRLLPRRLDRDLGG